MNAPLRTALLLCFISAPLACSGPRQPARGGDGTPAPGSATREATPESGPHRIFGQVSEAAGAPAAAVEVSVALLGPEGTLAAMMNAKLYHRMRRSIPGSEVLFQRVWTITADDDGRYELSGLPEGYFSLWAGAGATTSMERLAHLSTEVPEESVELTLGTPILLRGVVKTEEGAPQPGATVGIITGDTELPDRVTASDGSFQAEVSAVRSVHLGVRFEGRVASPVIGAEPDAAVEVVLFRPRTVRGVVTQDGGPVSGATIETDAPGIEGSSGDDGSFVLADLPGRSLRLRATHSKLGISSPQAVDLTRESVEGLQIELKPLPALVVQVNDESGAALAGVKVELKFYGANVPAPLEGTTAEDGRWVFESIPVGFMYGASAAAEGRASAHQNIALQPGRRSETTLTLKPAHPVLVRVSRPETVTSTEDLKVELAGMGGGAEWHHQHEAPVGPGAPSSLTRLEGVAPGTYLARVWSADVTSRPVEVTVPGPEVELVLEPAGSLRGRVVDKGGAPLAGVVVEAWHPGWPSPDGGRPRTPPRWSRSAVSEDDGRFRVTGVGSGGWVTMVRTHGPVRSALSEPRPIGADRTEVVLAVRRPESPPKISTTVPRSTTAEDYRALCGAVDDLLAAPGFERMPISARGSRHSEFRRRWKKLQSLYEKRSSSERGRWMVRVLGQAAPDQRYDNVLGIARADGVKGEVCPEVVRVWTPEWVDAAGTLSWDLYLLCTHATAARGTDPVTVRKRVLEAFEKATSGTDYPHPGRATILEAAKLPKKQRYRALLAAARKAGIQGFACPALQIQWEGP